MALITNALCSLADLQRLFSSTGVTSFADHDQNGSDDSGVTDDCINQATEEISLYTQKFYALADLVSSTLINRWATTLGVVFLCQRRGNPVPESLQSEFERIMQKLEQIAAGTLQVPGIAMRANLLPSFDNLTVDQRYPRSTIRVTQANSSENMPSTLSQDLAPEVVYE